VIQPEDFRDLALNGVIAIKQHAEKRRIRREVPQEAIEYILELFDVIEFYPNAFPFPAMLLRGVWEDRTLHIVAGFDLSKQIVHVITVYEPDSEHFEPDWRTRRRN